MALAMRVSKWSLETSPPNDPVWNGSLLLIGIGAIFLEALLLSIAPYWLH